MSYSAYRNLWQSNISARTHNSSNRIAVMPTSPQPRPSINPNFRNCCMDEALLRKLERQSSTIWWLDYVSVTLRNIHLCRSNSSLPFAQLSVLCSCCEYPHPLPVMFSALSCFSSSNLSIKLDKEQEMLPSTESVEITHWNYRRTHNWPHGSLLKLSFASNQQKIGKVSIV